MNCGPWSKVSSEAYGKIIEVFKRIKQEIFSLEPETVMKKVHRENPE